MRFPTSALLAAWLALAGCDSPIPSEPANPSPPAIASAAPATPNPPTPAPVLELSCQAEPRAGDTPLTVRFTAFPSGGTGSYDFRWDFGDGAAATSRRATHTYLTPGVHAAALTVSSGGQSRRCDRPIAVTGLPVSPVPAPSPGSAPPGDLVITIVGMAGSQSYAPNPAVAQVGQRVVWRNADSLVHTATANGGAFDTGLLAAGASSAPLTLASAGAFPYFCGLHPSMVATLVVNP